MRTKPLTVKVERTWVLETDERNVEISGGSVVSFKRKKGLFEIGDKVHWCETCRYAVKKNHGKKKKHKTWFVGRAFKDED